MRNVLQHRLTHRFACPDGQWHEELARAAEFSSIIHAARFCADHGLTDMNFLHLASDGQPLLTVELCGSNHLQATQHRL